MLAEITFLPLHRAQQEAASNLFRRGMQVITAYNYNYCKVQFNIHLAWNSIFLIVNSVLYIFFIFINWSYKLTPNCKIVVGFKMIVHRS
jgi:hypothetical protein